MHLSVTLRILGLLLMPRKNAHATRYTRPKETLTDFDVQKPANRDSNSSSRSSSQSDSSSNEAANGTSSRPLVADDVATEAD